MLCGSEQMKELAFPAGEPEAYCYADSTEGEHILIRGGNWNNGGYTDVFCSSFFNIWSDPHGSFGGRSAFYKQEKRQL
jgi:hypothetical protein